MTHEQWIALTPEQQRIKVAELCGWTFIEMCGTPPRLRGNGPTVNGIKSRAAWVPDYLNDLNAMHEAEKLLVGGLSWKYHKQLCDIAMEEWRATASQRAEAFVLTMEG